MLRFTSYRFKWFIFVESVVVVKFVAIGIDVIVGIDFIRDDVKLPVVVVVFLIGGLGLSLVGIGGRALDLGVGGKGGGLLGGIIGVGICLRFGTAGGRSGIGGGICNIV